jgi:GAF domain-containing protein
MNARLHAALERESKERETLSEIGKILSSSLDIDEAYQRFAELASELIDFDLIQVVLLNQDGETYTNAYMAGDDDITFDEKQVIPLKGTMTEGLSRSGTGFVINVSDLADGIHRYPTLQARFEAGVRSILGVPLVTGGNSVGAIYIDSKSVNAFSSQDLHNATRVAAQISGILANSELRAALERESNGRKVLADIGRVISLSLDIDEVYRRFAELVVELIDFDLIQISLLNENGDRFNNAYTAGHETLQAAAQRSARLEGTFTEQVLHSESGLILNFGDAEKLLRDYPLMQRNLEVGTMSLLAVALVSGDKPIGVMYLHSLSVDSYGDADLELAQRVSAQISGAIANAQLHADLERESNERHVLSRSAG